MGIKEQQFGYRMEASRGVNYVIVSLSEPHVAGYVVFGFLTSQQRQAVAYTNRFHPLKAKSVEIFLISNELLALL